MKWKDTDLSTIQSRGMENSAHSMLGLGALVAEMAEQGITAAALLQGTGLAPEQLADPKALMSTEQKITVFRNIRRLSSVPDVGLRAGCRQRLSDFGVYGYALISSATFGDAVLSGVRHVKLAGPVLEKRFRVDGDTAIFEGRDVLQLGDILPLSTEFWFSSIQKLGHTILEAPLANRRLKLPYGRPAYAAAYEQVFNCPIEFDAGVMEWHFDAAVLRQPCPNAKLSLHGSIRTTAIAAKRPLPRTVVADSSRSRFENVSLPLRRVALFSLPEDVCDSCCKH